MLFPDNDRPGVMLASFSGSSYADAATAWPVGSVWSIAAACDSGYGVAAKS